MQKKTVFLLQDTKELNQELFNLFTENGFEVVGSAVDGVSGLNGIKELKPQFVLM